MGETVGEKRTLSIDQAKKILQVADDDRVRMREGIKPDLTQEDVDELRTAIFNSEKVTQPEKHAASRIIVDWERRYETRRVK